MSAPLVRLDDVSCIFQGVIRALDGVALSIAEGETVALLGPSGSGKSTLLSLIAGFEKPTSGTVAVAGRPVGDWPQQTLYTRMLGFLFQRYHLLEHLSASRNVELAMFPTVSDPRQRREKSRQLLERVGLGARIDSRALHLSGGERQRVAFCRSIANQPRLLLADEPTGSLDQASKRPLLDLLVEHTAAQGGTLVVATHDPAVADICGRTIRLEDGRILAS